MAAIDVIRFIAINSLSKWGCAQLNSKPEDKHKKQSPSNGSSDRCWNTNRVDMGGIDLDINTYDLEPKGRLYIDIYMQAVCRYEQYLIVKGWGVSTQPKKELDSKFFPEKVRIVHRDS